MTMPARTYPAHDTERHALIERLEALARFGGTIAHDLNNQLTTVLGYTEVLTHTLPQDASLQHIRSAGERAAVYTRAVMDVSRRKRALARELVLNDVLHAAGPTIIGLVPKGCTCAITSGDGSLRFLCDRAQLEQVLHHGVINAVEAGATRITITGGANAGGDRVVILVADDGCGIDPEKLPRVFEPLVSTKADKGSGFGLTDAALTIHRLGGDLVLTSEPGVGTTLAISFPRTR